MCFVEYLKQCRAVAKQHCWAIHCIAKVVQAHKTLPGTKSPPPRRGLMVQARRNVVCTYFKRITYKTKWFSLFYHLLLERPRLFKTRTRKVRSSRDLLFLHMDPLNLYASLSRRRVTFIKSTPTSLDVSIIVGNRRADGHGARRHGQVDVL